MDFFSYKLGPAWTFVDQFNTMHLITLAVMAAMIAAIVVFRKQLRRPSVDKFCRIGGTVIAIAFEATLHLTDFYNLSMGNPPEANPAFGAIPLELCAISLWLCVALNISKNTKVFDFVYFTAIGAVISLIVPNEMGLGPDRARFYVYFGVHLYIVMTVVYFAVVRGYRIHLRSLLKTYAVFIPLSVYVRELNRLSGGNYLYLNGHVSFSSPLDLFPENAVRNSPVYYLSLLAVAVVVFALMALPWVLSDRRKAR